MRNAIDDFIKALALAGVSLDTANIAIDDLGCPHTQKGLPSRKMAIYTFQMNGQFLKIGKAGSNSNARFRSHHYNPSRAKSNLAKSLLCDKEMAKYNLDNANIEDWIRNNIHRIDILIDKDVDIFVLNFLESFLHCKFKPKYEGFKNQR